jgi:DNA-binding NarL/FixJ family response regulator
MTIRVVIADDQGMVRAGFRSLLAHESDIEVVGEAADGQAAVAIVRHTRPDVVLMDIRMPVLDGLAATRRLMAEPQPPRVLALTTFDLDQYVYEALRAGAAGFLLKDATVEDLVAAIRTLAAGNAILDPAVTRRVIEAFVRSKPPDPSATAKLDRLTEREVQVLRLIARGLSNAEFGPPPGGDRRDRQDTRQQCVDQAGPAGSRPRCHLRLRDRPGATRRRRLTVTPEPTPLVGRVLPGDRAGFSPPATPPT